MDPFAPFAPTTVTDHRPVAGCTAAPVGLRDLLRGALRGVAPADVQGDGRALAEAEAIVVFDFGCGTDDRPSPVNDALASVVAAYPDTPVLAQHETARALAATGRAVIDIEESARRAAGIAPGSHVATGRVVESLAGFVDRAGWTTIGVVAHPAHVARCVATCQRLGLRVVTENTAAFVDAWDPHSAQWWTRRSSWWAAREMAVVAHHMATGRVLLRL